MSKENVVSESKSKKKYIIDKVNIVLSGIRELRTKDEYQSVGSNAKMAMEVAFIASIIGFKCVDCTYDELNAQFYDTAVKDVVIDILGELNEKIIIDIDKLERLVFNMWRIRYDIGCGHLHPFSAVDALPRYFKTEDAELIATVSGVLGYTKPSFIHKG